MLWAKAYRSKLSHLGHNGSYGLLMVKVSAQAQVANGAHNKKSS